MNEDETKPKAELNFNLTNLVENVETGAGLDVLKNVIEDWRWNEHNLLLRMWYESAIFLALNHIFSFCLYLPDYPLSSM